MIGTFVASLAAPGLAAPVGDAGLIIVADSGDSAWLLACTLIGALCAIPGILLYVTAPQPHALGKVATITTAAIALSTLLFLLCGFSLAFSPDGTVWIGGMSQWMLNDMGTIREGATVPETGFVLFQLVLAWATATLLCAVLAMRARAAWLLGFTAFWLLLVLVPITRWMWGGGWLAEMGALDGTGGMVIFFSVAASAYVALLLIGRGAEKQVGPTNDMMRLGGALLMLVGMTALAGGATLGAGDNAAVAMLAMVASGMTGALTNAAVNRSLGGSALASGIVTGIVTVAVAGDGISVGSAWLMAATAVVIVHFAPRLLPRALSPQDDSSSVIQIAAAAKVGALLFAVFLAFEPFQGSGYADGMTMTSQLIAQFTALLTIAGWSIFGTLVAALMVGLVTPMRADGA